MKLRVLALITIFTNIIFAQNYHDTQGKLDISNGGQSNFTIPIAMPPSINSIGPTINLAYTSGTASGLAGQGWNINSISSIARISNRLDIEGFRDGVDFDQDDKLALDGQYLLLKSGNYWSSGSLYQTEVQSNVKIELQGSGTSMYFIVTAPDGSRSWYGNYNGEIASDLTAFYLTRYEDTDGNIITYHYNSSFNSLFISEIKFSANINTNPTPLNKILFTYKNTSRVESYYIKGIEVKRDKIIDKIEVFTNDLLFKKYQLTHLVDDSGYERVTKVQEYNANNEPANPINFEYNQTNYSPTESYRVYQGGFSPTFTHITSGDFDGDGRLDFANANQIYLNLFSPTGNFYLNDNIVNLPITLIKDKTFPITTLQNNKLTQKQSILKINENLGSIDFMTYSLEGSSLLLKNTKTILINNEVLCDDMCQLSDGDTSIISNPEFGCSTGFIPGRPSSSKFLEGDFNGDSISEILIINNKDKVEFNLHAKSPEEYYIYDDYGNLISTEQPPYQEFLCKSEFVTEGINEIRLLDLNPNNPSSSNTIGNFSIQTPEIGFLNSAKFYISDFNGDGKSDLMAIHSDGNYKVFGFKENFTSQTIEMEIIGKGINTNYKDNKQIMFGDYNGDSKTDIMLPDGSANGCISCNTWHVYYSNPKLDQTEMFEKITLPIVSYWPNSGSYWTTALNTSQYIAMDINKDGKTDLLRVWMQKYQPSPFWDDKDWDSEWRVEAYINNIGKNGNFNLEYSSANHGNEDPGLPMPFIANFDFVGGGRYDKINADIAVLRWHGRIEYLDITKDFNEDNLLKKVSQSNNSIVDEITYKKMLLPSSNNGLGTLGEFYSSTDSYNYPLVEFKQMSTNNLVSRLTNTSGGTTKNQDFKYHGLTFDLKGIGAIGFKKVVRSNWYFLDSDKKIWVETISDPLKRGAIVSSITYKPYQTFSFANSGSTYNTFLSKKEFNFQQINPVNTYPFILQKNTEKNTDYLTNVVNETEYFYSNDGYNLENKSISKNYLSYNPSLIQGKNEIITNYENNPSGIGANFYIGRPIEIISTKKIFANTVVNNLTDNSNTQVSNEKLFYSNNNLIKTEKTANNSPEKLVEEFIYFSNGLLQRTTLSAQGTTIDNAVAPVVTEYTYDSTNRFIKTTKNVNDNLTITNNSFDPVYGLVTSSTNAIGQSTSSLFDSWGKRTKITDFLGISITYAYAKNGNIYTTTTENVNDGSSSIIEQDELAREIRKGTKDLNGNWNYVKTEYDGFGRKYRISEPYAANASPSQWSTTEFDDLSRPIKSISHTGKIVETTHNGLMVSATEPTMSKSKTINSLGLVVSATDTPGGTITYKYDANGNLLESDYEGIKTKIEYDKWGRKEKLDDTSAGIYTYKYDAFSRIKNETTPKGSRTYSYDSGGRIITKTVTGLTTADATNMTATYAYDSVKRLTNLSVLNPIDGNSSYVYIYDTTTQQLNQTIEKLYVPGATTPIATFTKTIDFDLLGRVNNETSKAESYGKTSTKTINHVYKNGAEWQLKDGTTIVWQANTVNSRGQLTSYQLGNGIISNNTYDAYGYLTQQKQDLGATNKVTLSNQFDPVLGNLMNRYNSLFDSNESFEYDNLDRLVKWDGVSTNILNLPFNTTTDGFTFNGTSLTGSVSNSSGKLKVALKNTLVYANKTVSSSVMSGDKLRVKADITNKTGTLGVIVNAVMVETDPNDPFNFIEIPFGIINNGAFETNYIVTDFVPNPILSLRFIIDESSPENPNGISTGIDGEIQSFPPNTIFYVDNLKIDKIPSFNQSYDNKGRITQNRIGDYKYEIANKPYQNSKVRFSPEGQSYYTVNANNDLDIKYNMYSSPYKITHATKDVIDLSYNITEQRSMMYWGNTNADKNLRPFRRYYSADGSMEVTAKFTAGNYTTPSSVEIITFVDGTAYNSEVVLKNTYTGTATTPTGGLFYLHRDYQGSIVAITNSAGAIIEKRQFDPWGLLTKIQDGAGNNLTKLTFFDRGYTGHEHLESVGLINMNGRVYDPVLHRFLQPDSQVQEPYNTQNYNRYGYCLNNPMKYTDISGEDFGLTFAISMGAALVMYFGDAILNDKPITFRGIATTVVTTAVSGGVAYGIGTAATSIGNFYTRATFQALSHGLTQGGMTALTGGKFWSGFAAGSISSIMSSAWQGGESFKKVGDVRSPDFANDFKGIGGVGANKTVGTMFFGTISGGAGSALSGGNFWKGAVTGLVVSGLNHAAHSMMDDGFEGEKDKEKPKKTGTVNKTTFKVDQTFKVNIKLDVKYNLDSNGNFTDVAIQTGSYGYYIGGDFQQDGNFDTTTYGKTLVFKGEGHVDNSLTGVKFLPVISARTNYFFTGYIQLGNNGNIISSNVTYYSTNSE